MRGSSQTCLGYIANIFIGTVKPRSLNCSAHVDYVFLSMDSISSYGHYLDRSSRSVTQSVQFLLTFITLSNNWRYKVEFQISTCLNGAIKNEGLNIMSVVWVNRGVKLKDKKLNKKHVNLIRIINALEDDLKHLSKCVLRIFYIYNVIKLKIFQSKFLLWASHQDIFKWRKFVSLICLIWPWSSHWFHLHISACQTNVYIQTWRQTNRQTNKSPRLSRSISCYNFFIL